MKAKQSKKQDKQYQIPMVVTDEVIRDFGIKQEDVTWRRIGNRKCRVVMVDATEKSTRRTWFQFGQRSNARTGMAVVWSKAKTADSSAARKATAVRSASTSRRPAVSGISQLRSPY